MTDIAERLARAGLWVKPLDWRIPTEPLCHDHWTADGLGGFYHMAPDEDSPGSWLLQWTLRPDDFCMKYGGPMTKHGLPEAARAAAEADHEARILAAIEVMKDE
jgi:hypothetical protein